MLISYCSYLAFYKPNFAENRTVELYQKESRAKITAISLSAIIVFANKQQAMATVIDFVVTLSQQGKWKAAEAIFQRVVAFSSRKLHPYSVLTDPTLILCVHKTQGQFEQAFSLSLKQQKLISIIDYTKTLCEQEKWKEAEIESQKIGALCTGEKNMYAILSYRASFLKDYAFHLYQQNRLAEAEIQYAKAFALCDPQDVVAEEYAEVLYRQEKFEKAEAIYRQILVFPSRHKDFTLIKHFAYTLYMQKKWPEAEIVLNIALAFPEGKKDYFRMMKYYAKTLFMLKKWPEAEDAFKWALALPGGSHDLGTIKGHAETLLMLNEYEQAKIAFEKAFALAGGKQDLSIISGHAKALQELKNMKSAFKSKEEEKI